MNVVFKVRCLALSLNTGTNMSATAGCDREICLGRNRATHAHNPGNNLRAPGAYGSIQRTRR